MTKEKNLGGLDYFKLIAAFLVVAIHTSPLVSFSAAGDMIFTRIIGRIAVPFFLMTTGYFLLPQYLLEKSEDKAPLLAVWKKLFLLYLLAIFIYFPVNLYTNHFKGIDPWGMISMIIFDGTFYHLWYLPGAILGIFLLFCLSRILNHKAVFCITIFLYMIGLLGDSYYGFLSGNGKKAFDVLFLLFSYTRNGIFYTPLFLALGAELKQIGSRKNHRFFLFGTAVSMSLMLWEGILLHNKNVSRHDSMYLMLPCCMVFLFLFLISWSIPPKSSLRKISTWIYLIHPMMILFVRGSAKLLHVEKLFINNSLLHYVSVCAGSFLFALLAERLSLVLRRPKEKKARAWIELDREALHHNIDELKRILPEGCRLMPAVKANAYGHGAVLMARECNQMGITEFCVATASEGVELRKSGISGEILILGYTHPKLFPLIWRYHLTQTVVDEAYGKTLNSCGRKIKVNIKIDTGMHRLGERWENYEKICNIFSLKNLVVTGIFTHLCVADDPEEKKIAYTKKQGEIFQKIQRLLKEQGYDCGKVHLLASDGLLHYPDFGGDYARVGIALYGLLSSRFQLEYCPVRLQPVLSLKARVAQVKMLYAGEGACYGLEYIAKKDKKIAVLTIGYGDGIPRALSNGRGHVLIRGKKAPIIGRLCMDQMLVDITDIPGVKANDTAILIGNTGNTEITVYDLAEAEGTITNEVLSQLGSRLERVWK